MVNRETRTIRSIACRCSSCSVSIIRCVPSKARTVSIIVVSSVTDCTLEPSSAPWTTRVPVAGTGASLVARSPSPIRSSACSCAKVAMPTRAIVPARPAIVPSAPIEMLRSSAGSVIGLPLSSSSGWPCAFTSRPSVSSSSRPARPYRVPAGVWKLS